MPRVRRNRRGLHPRPPRTPWVPVPPLRPHGPREIFRTAPRPTAPIRFALGNPAAIAPLAREPPRLPLLATVVPVGCRRVTLNPVIRPGLPHMARILVGLHPARNRRVHPAKIRSASPPSRSTAYGNLNSNAVSNGSTSKTLTDSSQGRLVIRNSHPQTLLPDAVRVVPRPLVPRPDAPTSRAKMIVAVAVVAAEPRNREKSPDAMPAMPNVNKKVASIPQPPIAVP